MIRLQEQFQNCGAALSLVPGEYEGPLRVDRPCVIDGGGATLWAPCGPVLEILVPGVTVKNLRVEVTEERAPCRTAIRCAAPVQLEQVEVNGAVEGVPGESPDWDLPPLIALGAFAADAVNVFSVPLQAAGPAELTCAIGGLTLLPARLAAGPQTISLRTAELRDHTILYGDILVKTAVTRRICVTGTARKDAPRRQDVPASLPRDSGPDLVTPPADLLAPSVLDPSVPLMRRGQRTGFPDLGRDTLKIALEYRDTRQPLELDAYVFLLQANQRVRGDADFLFFNNPQSRDRAVRMSGSALVLADLEKLDPAVERVAVCYSVYGDDPRKNFSQVRDPLLRVFSGSRELCRMKPEDLSVEKTLVAVEVYRYKGQWKLNFVASGYRDGLRRLCESYGVEVE
ncbi:MAG: hypothetical protein HFF90_05395 [Oscillibacter sp.]|nr:hypothetical protein [Oscillibacter sp.]